MKPAEGTSYHGHKSIAFGAIETLTSSRNLGDFVSAGGWTAYIVANYAPVGQDLGGYLRPSAFTDSASYWAIGGQAATNIDFFQRDTNGVQLDLKLTNSGTGTVPDVYRPGILQVYEVHADGSYFEARINNAQVKREATANANAAALGSTMKVATNYNNGAGFSERGQGLLGQCVEAHSERVARVVGGEFGDFGKNDVFGGFALFAQVARVWRAGRSTVGIVAVPLKDQYGAKPARRSRTTEAPQAACCPRW